MKLTVDPQGRTESMELEVDESSNIADATYHLTNHSLYIHFRSGGSVYEYFAVPPEIWEGLKSAESKGRYFHQSIKGFYIFRKANP